MRSDWRREAADAAVEMCRAHKFAPGMFYSTKRITEKAAERRVCYRRQRDQARPLSVLQADSQLAIGFLNRPDGVHAMPAKIVRGVLKVVLGIV